MRRARREDLPTLSNLWARCFGDSVAYVDAFWARFYDEFQVFVNEDCTAMAVVMPMRWQERSAAYLYAVCTAPEARGRGLCRTLIAEIEAELCRQGISYALLVPAEPHLFAFYEKMGYETVFFRSSRSGGAADAPKARRISPAEYGALRQAQLCGGVEYPLCLLELQETFGALYAVPGGCAAAEREDAGWLIRELLTDEPDAALASLAAELETASLTAWQPGAESPHGMAKSLDGAPLKQSYLGLSFG